ncbi:MAG: adenylate/guanylate cyclase domain-containing protein [Treponema sp.]|nr:adenylate/guanylate cyclase domain-containing protein [Treponema sp.]
MEKGNKNKKLRNLDYVVFAILALIFSLLGLFSVFNKLDFRLYDAMLAIKKEPEQSKDILHVNIDNESIDILGEWPWSRDIYADILIQMKELGAERAVFDVEFLSPSKKGVPADAIPNINLAFEERANEIVDSIYLLGDRISSGQIAKSEISGFTDDLVSQVVSPTIDELYSSVMDNAYRDNDEYFARAIQFFGNTWLTVNTREVIFSQTPEEIAYIDNRFLMKNVSDPKDYIKKSNDFTSVDQYNGEESGFSPAMHTFLKRARGVGFTNVVIDNDGVRRRVELLFNHNGNYLGQLTFGPLLNYLDVQKIERKNNKLILYDVKFPGKDERETVKIPLDDNGRMLINWLHRDFGDSFKQESAYSLVQLKFLEEDIAQNLSNLTQYMIRRPDGTLPDFLNDAGDLYDYALTIKDYKNQLLSKCTGFDENSSPYDGISQDMYDEYFSMKDEFYSYVLDYSSQDYNEQIDEVLNGIRKIDSSVDIAKIDEIKESLLSEIKTLYENVSSYVKYTKDLKEKFNGAICIIGNTASSTTDLGATPFVRAYFNVGTHANVINTVLQKNFIYPVNWLSGFIFTVLVTFLVFFLCHNMSNTSQNIFNGITLFAIVLLPFILMLGFSIYIPFVTSIVFAILAFIGGLTIRFILSSREKRFIVQMASSFANKDTVDFLRKNPDKFNTSGEKKGITALFSDIQKFSTFSEGMGLIYGEEGPNKLIQNLNEYLGAMSNEILANNGTIDKYEGDAIISMFGAPDPDRRHTVNEWSYLCLDSAIKMKKVEQEFNKAHGDLFKKYMVTAKDEDGFDIQKEIELKPFQTRIGINTGDAFVGLMGSQTEQFSKMNYTMIGDTVNLASRLEGVNKVYGTWIMCSDETWNSANTGANEGKIVSKRLDRVRVVGRSTPVQLYTILGFRDEMSDKELEEIELFHKAIDLYLERNFVEAEKLFRDANAMNPDDAAALVFADRCHQYGQNGVQKNWDGVMNMTSK